MLTISKALASGQAKQYYEKDFSSGRESYYTEKDSIAGQWYGRLAEQWELRGEVQREQFERLADGQDPKTGKERSDRIPIAMIYVAH